MGLFDSIFSKIQENEKQRIIAEEKMRNDIKYFKTEVEASTFLCDNLKKSMQS